MIELALVILAVLCSRWFDKHKAELSALPLFVGGER